jgi:hypothetical protein
VLPTTLAGANLGSWPDAGGVRGRERTEIGSMETSVIDCCTVSRILQGAAASGPQAMTSGTVLIESRGQLHVTASYTMVTGEGAGASIDVEVIEPQRHVLREPAARPEPPAATARPEPRLTPPPRPQDLPRRDGQDNDGKKPEGKNPDGKPKEKKIDKKPGGRRARKR